MGKPVIIGFVGLPGAGKTTAAAHLESKGFIRITLSDFIRSEATKRGHGKITRDLLQDIGNEMRETFGPQILAQLAHKKIRSENLTHVIIDGIRNLYEIAYLGVENNFTLIGITAKPELRFRRLTNRKDTKQFSGTYKDFLYEEEREENLGSRETGLRVSECLKKAKYFVSNNVSQKQFIAKLDKVLVKIIGLKTRTLTQEDIKNTGHSLRVIILGSPGAGKTTQGKLLSVALKIPCLSMGEILRDAYKRGDYEGIEWWDKYGRKGLNAPIQLKFPLLVKRLVNADNGFILDDFPRTSEDLDALRQYMRLSHADINKVILLEVTEETARDRMMKRFMSNAKRGIARFDDSPYILKIRIKEGYMKELPVIRSYFEKSKLLYSIDGNDGKSIKDVHKEIVNEVIGNHQ